MELARLQQQMQFLIEIDKLKAVFCQNYMADGSRRVLIQHLKNEKLFGNSYPLWIWNTLTECRKLIKWIDIIIREFVDT